MITMLGTTVSVLIRLKNVPQEPVQPLPRDLKAEIISVYTNNVLMTKTQISEHSLVRRFLDSL